eukprot:TRINITY_DN8774_c0_g1_i18.p1 TRINITY_DN8774_c0_g1~~TRINITY_DN8774_c0_g1_i18.p1  ORF type:complete len:202 (-),score=67.22 TRINITY_DN8774_c0_g1_i18:107-712(-)
MSEILVAPTNSLGKGEELMKEVLKSLNEADKQMEELDTEFRVLKSRADKSLQAKFTALKKRYNKARSDYFQHSEVLSDLRNRKELYRSPVSRTQQLNDEANAQHRENLKKTGEQTKKLNEMVRMGEDARNIAQETASRMNKQTGYLLDANNYVGRTEQDARDIRSMLNKISRREFFYKLFLYLLIAVLFLVILGLLIRKVS